MLGQYITNDGYILTVYSSLYVDYGLRIERFGKTLFNSPCCLGNEAYGANPPEEMEWEDWVKEGFETEGSIWTEEDWQTCLQNEAWDLLDAFLEPEA